MGFQLTRLMRGVTFKNGGVVFAITSFQLTRLMRGVTSAKSGLKQRNFSFQLTRLMRGVTFGNKNFDPECVISTHTPHARRDNGVTDTLQQTEKFQLTRLMRGVTNYLFKNSKEFSHFNSHASCEA